MPMKVVRLALPGTLASALALLVGLGPDASRAMGLGQPQVQSALGRPLDISVPLSLADGEQLADNCLRVEVVAGDARVPAGLLQLRVEGSPGQQRLRLQSLVAIDEPVLRVTLALGCPLRLTREFNALIDPPAGAAPSPMPAVAEALPEPAAAPVPAPAPGPLSTAQPARREAARPSSPRRPVQHKPKLKPAAAPVSGPRLVLERPEVLVAAQAAQPAASAASAAASAPDVAETIQRLEKAVADLQAELKARQQALSTPAPTPAPVRAQTVSPYRDPMTWLLTLGLSLLAGSAAFFGSRWLDQRPRRAAQWHSPGPAADSTAPPLAHGPTPGLAPLASMEVAAAREGTTPIATFRPAPWALEPQVNFLATQPVHLRSGAVSDSAPARTEAEALLDLQQQVDFLLLLGQQDAACDLIRTHIADDPAAGPMAWLMLLELLRQRDDSQAQDELARRFESHFGWPVPQGPGVAQGLEGSPRVLASLETAWTDPAKTLPQLGGLLASGRASDGKAFGLSALHDLLTLYGVVRDVQEGGGRSGAGVDLMLP